MKLAELDQNPNGFWQNFAMINLSLIAPELKLLRFAADVVFCVDGAYGLLDDGVYINYLSKS